MTDTATAENSHKRPSAQHIKTTRDEFNRVAALAGQRGLTVDEYVRSCMGYAYPPAQLRHS